MTTRQDWNNLKMWMERNSLLQMVLAFCGITSSIYSNFYDIAPEYLGIITTSVPWCEWLLSKAAKEPT